ncbi:MAG TPA: hypothetical protein PLK27_09150, partial [Neisseria sp.]|nr:hypothetical protein [Neisseria sp.]
MRTTRPILTLLPALLLLAACGGPRTVTAPGGGGWVGGSVPQLGYFGFPIAAYTLLTDPDIPVNRYRFKALHDLAARFKGLSEAARSRIVGYSLG